MFVYIYTHFKRILKHKIPYIKTSSLQAFKFRLCIPIHGWYYYPHSETMVQLILEQHVLVEVPAVTSQVIWASHPPNPGSPR